MAYRKDSIVIGIYPALLVAGLVLVLARCWQLQYYRADHYKQRAARQQIKIVPQSARRGMIVDRNGNSLAMSVRAASVSVDPGLISNKKEAAIRLSEILGLDADELYERLLKRKDRRYMSVKRFVSEEKALRIRSLGMFGVMTEWVYQRRYPMGQLAAHVLGFADSYGKGLEGVEALYNENLSGQDGKIVFRSDVRRRPIGPQGVCKPSRDGDTLVLTIDAVIQACVEEELQKVVDKFGAKAATAIVMDPGSGEVLAMANLPTFEPTKAGQCAPRFRRNQALTDTYEPGSTFKPFTAAAALEGGFVTSDQKIDCLEGPYRGKGFRPIKEYKHYFGSISVSDIIVRSSNIGSAKLAQKMGKKYFHKMVENFGFGRKTGIDLPGEDDGNLRKEWNDKEHTLTRVGFGQGIAVTPIQLICAFCSLANGGKLIKPRVVRGIISSDDGEVVEDFGACYLPVGHGQMVAGTDGAGRIISQEVAREMVTGALRGVVARTGGTAHNAHLEEWVVFGKTGTAQIAGVGGYLPNKYVSSFIAGAPAENPRVCVLVAVREPNRSLGLGYTGGMVAAPVVKEILQETLAYLEVPKEKTDIKVASGRI